MISWELPVIQDRKEIKDQVHHKTKYHCFDDSVSLCRKYYQEYGAFETNIESGQIILMPLIACSICYKKWRKEFNISDGENDD